MTVNQVRNYMINNMHRNSVLYAAAATLALLSDEVSSNVSSEVSSNVSSEVSSEVSSNT